MIDFGTCRAATIFALLIASSAAADDYYVSLAGSDVIGTGGVATPWRTITHALRVIPAPTSAVTHTIHVGGGSWHPDNEVFPILVPPGIAIQGAGIDVTIFSGVRATSRSQPLGNGQTVFRFTRPATVGSVVPPARLSHCTLMNSRSSVEVSGVQGIPRTQIDTCRFWLNQIALTSTNAAPQIHECIFDTNNIGLSAGRIANSPDDTEVRRNLFVNNQYGINVANAMQLVIDANRFDRNAIGCMLGAIGFVTISPTLQNNVYWRNGQGLLMTAVLGGVVTAKVRHETLWGNGTGIASMDDFVFGGRSDPDIRNTSVWASAASDLHGVWIQEIHNSNIGTAIGVPIGPMYGVNGMMGADPSHVDPVRGDLHLRPDSPLIDRGREDYANPPLTDTDVEPRKTGDPDLGADEMNEFLVHARAGARARELRLVLTSPTDANKPYYLAASYRSNPSRPIHLGRRTIALFPDVLFNATFGPNPRIPGFAGTLGPAGRAIVSVNVPNHPLLRGTTVYLGFITLDPMKPQGIATISNVIRVDTDTL